ncbi:MAG: hypothetical protein AAFZ18_12120, partial [Myxococcota bacterium]
QRVLASARREAHRINFSFLVLAPPDNRHPATHRLLAHRIQAKQKVLAELCTMSGHQTVVALRRNREVYDKLLHTPPAAALRVDLAALNLRGDGYRLEQPDDFEVEWGPAPPTGSGGL